MAQAKKTFKQLFLDTVYLIKKNLAGLAGVVAIAYVPFCLLFFLLLTPAFIFKDKFDMLSPGRSIAVSIIFIILFAAFVTFVFLALVLFSIAIIKKIKACDEQQPLSPWAAYQESMPLLGPFLIVILWVLLKVGLWSLLLIIPGIVFALFYSFAQLVFILDGKRGVGALKASRDIIQPYFFEFVWKSFVVGALFFAVSWSFGFIIEHIFPLKVGYDPIIAAMSKNFINGFLGIFPTTFGYFLYKDLKGRNSTLA